MAYLSKTGKKQPRKARGTRYKNQTQSNWHDLAVRMFLFMERKAPGNIRYALLCRWLSNYGVKGAEGGRILVPTLKRTLKRKRKMVEKYRILYSNATAAELLGKATKASRAQREQTTIVA
jgi:hypothetical protein